MNLFAVTPERENNDGFAVKWKAKPLTWQYFGFKPKVKRNLMTLIKQHFLINCPM